MSYQPIENYAIVGDMNTVGLIGLDGSVDFLSFPHFDSPTIFCALLDDEKGGCFRIAPDFPTARQKQIYLPDTNILYTRFLSTDGVAEVTDYMTLHEGWEKPCLVRVARGVSGESPFRMICQPRFDYARVGHTLRVDEKGAIFESEGPTPLAIRLRSSVPIETESGAVTAQFRLGAGEEAWFVLEEADPNGDTAADSPDFISRSFRETAKFWQDWTKKSTYRGRYQEAVTRSALCLKLLTSQTHGSVIAAPTFGLPETIGGARNWDYRYTWIRDASFTLYALNRLGYTNESARFMSWIENRCAELNPDGSLQIMYGFDGRHELPEEALSHLSGYKNSKPVRIGNGAHDQLQLDIYGELMDSVYLHNKFGEPIHHDLWQNLVRLVDWVCMNWHREDEGIWEVRGGTHEFLYSRLMCWVAIDRAIRLSVKRSLPAPLARWHEHRDVIYSDIMTSFWDPHRGAFTQFKGGRAVDASALLMPLVKFIGPTDPRWLSTLRAIENELVEDSLVYRYRGEDSARDGLESLEGTFSICSFWYIECLSRAGDVEKARFSFEKMLGHANHVGLYAEELGRHGEALGNFPQAFTHLGLISAATNLDRMLGT